MTNLVKNVLEENRTYAASKRIHLQGFLPSGPVIVDADEMRMREALDNLVNNAIKFSPLDRAVEISLRETDSLACILVKDHGPGLTNEDKLSVFGPYQRLSAIPTGGEISIGIGLTFFFTAMHHALPPSVAES